MERISDRWLVPFFGITADFSGAYKSGSKLHTYTFGPEVRAHIASLRPFAHALIGGGTSSGPISNGATNGLVMFYGGAWMLEPADWLPSVWGSLTGWLLTGMVSLITTTSAIQPGRFSPFSTCAASLDAHSGLGW